MSAIKIIQALGRKIAAKKAKTPEGITQIQPQIYAESEAGTIAQRLVDAGLPVERFDEFIFSEADLVRLLNQIEALEKKNLAESIKQGIRNTESAKVFDLKGKRIKDTDNIMGGEEMPPPGSRGGKDDIAAPVQSSEESLKSMIEAENKKNIAAMKQRKMLDDAIEDASPGFSGDRKVDAELVAENLAERMGLVYDDLPTKQRLDIYDQAYTGLTKKKFDPPEDLATGGRVGYKDGPKFDVQASGTKSGKQQIKNAPKGITIDKETFNAIVKADIPLSEKIDLLASYEYGKGRDKIEKDGQELFLGEGGFKDRNIGLGFNKEGEGFGGTLMYNLETGKPRLNIGFKKSFADGGRIGLKFGTGKKFLQKVFGKEKFKEMATRDPEMYQGLLEVVDMYRKRDKEGLKMYLQKFLPQMDDEAIEAFIKGSDGTEGLVGELIRLGSGRDYAGKLEMMKRSNEMRKLDDLEVTEDMLRKPNADGGIMRLGFKDGMNRRTFLKFLAGAASIPIIGKIFKPLKMGKTVTQVPIIKTDAVPGKPEWFDQLVNKVILEGDDVTKRFATAERQSIHQKTLDNGAVVRVTEDMDDGAVRVEYDSPDNVFEDTVQMQYKKSLPDEGDPRPTAEFTTAESGPIGRQSGPDDYDIDIDEVGGTSISDLDSDVSILKEYATGEKPTMKELVQNIKRKDKAKRITTDPEAQSDAIIKRQGEMLDYDPEPDFARGGIARMLGE
jgi:hypothetical protein